MKRIAISKILFRVAILFCFGIGLDLPAILSAQQTVSPPVGVIKPGPVLTQKETTAASPTQGLQSKYGSVSPEIVGVWTYAGTGTVNTYWVRRPVPRSSPSTQKAVLA